MINHIVNYDPYTHLNELSRRLFAAQTTRPTAVRLPIDVREETERFVIEADVPGLAPEDLEIVVTPEQLTLRGTRRAGAESGALRRERGEYKFERSFTLPRGIDLDGVEATLAAGVLALSLPKRASDRPRTIAVKPAATSSA